jgi:oxalate decarboxylase/phosphoglucose isomerase-like protein (cupin superfamily)
MAVSYMDFTAPDLQYKYDLSDNPFFQKDRRNFINALGIKQLNTIGNTFLLDVFLSKGNSVEPHYHHNASELIYCITGSSVISMINPFTNELIELQAKPGEAVTIPQGWWHYFTATENQSHLLTIYDTPELQTVFGSDVLRLTPPGVLSQVYCLDEKKVKEAFAPIHDTVIIGPPAGCHHQSREQEQQTYVKPAYWQSVQPYYNPYYG